MWVACPPPFSLSLSPSVERGVEEDRLSAMSGQGGSEGPSYQVMGVTFPGMRTGLHHVAER